MKKKPLTKGEKYREILKKIKDAQICEYSDFKSSLVNRGEKVSTEINFYSSEISLEFYEGWRGLKYVSHLQMWGRFGSFILSGRVDFDSAVIAFLWNERKIEKTLKSFCDDFHRR